MMRSFLVVVVLVLAISSAWAVERPSGAIVCTAAPPQEVIQEKVPAPVPKGEGKKIEVAEPNQQGEWQLGQPLLITLHGKAMYLPVKAPAGISQASWDQQLLYAKAGGYWTLILYYWDEKRQIWQTAIDFEGIEVAKRSLISGPRGERYLPLDEHPAEPHGHRGRFQVLAGEFYRDVDHQSNIWHCLMPNALRYLAGHFIHGALSDVIAMLGLPDSHGCSRNVPKIADWRFGWLGPVREYWVGVTNDQQLSELLALKGDRWSFIPAKRNK